MSANEGEQLTIIEYIPSAFKNATSDAAAYNLIEEEIGFKQGCSPRARTSVVTLP
jgi:hypothetical protein